MALHLRLRCLASQPRSPATVDADGFSSNPHLAPSAERGNGVYGWTEGRDPNAFFNTKGYLDTYADVKASGVNPLMHYDQFG
jgi:hypothetical protein